MPANFWGSEPAYEGEAYAAAIAYNDLTLEREYLHQPLDQALVIGATYQVRFRVSLADNSEFAIDRLGAAFHSGAVTQSGYGPLPLTPCGAEAAYRLRAGARRCRV